MKPIFFRLDLAVPRGRARSERAAARSTVSRTLEDTLVRSRCGDQRCTTVLLLCGPLRRAPALLRSCRAHLALSSTSTTIIIIILYHPGPVYRRFKPTASATGSDGQLTARRLCERSGRLLTASLSGAPHRALGSPRYIPGKPSGSGFKVIRTNPTPVSNSSALFPTIRPAVHGKTGKLAMLMSACGSGEGLAEQSDSSGSETTVCDKAGKDRVSMASRGSVMDKIRS
ncbi:unnamed protein product [Arctogadus glacialis]